MVLLCFFQCYLDEANSTKLGLVVSSGFLVGKRFSRGFQNNPLKSTGATRIIFVGVLFSQEVFFLRFLFERPKAMSDKK